MAKVLEFAIRLQIYVCLEGWWLKKTINYVCLEGSGRLGVAKVLEFSI